MSSWRRSLRLLATSLSSSSAAACWPQAASSREFVAERGELSAVLAQLAIAAVVEDGERIDRAVQRELAPQSAEMSSLRHWDAGGRVHPTIRGAAAIGIAQPVLSAAGEHDASVRR